MMSVDLRRESHWNNLPPHQLCRLREIFAHGISRAQYQDISEEFRDKQLSRDWANTNKKLSSKRLFYWIQLEFLSIIRVRVVNLSHQTCGGNSISDKHSICLRFRLLNKFHPHPCASINASLSSRSRHVNELHEWLKILSIFFIHNSPIYVNWWKMFTPRENRASKFSNGLTSKNMQSILIGR